MTTRGRTEKTAGSDCVDGSEAARYNAVRSVTERYAGDGFVLDIGCSQGILQEGLRYGRYLGVDNCEQSITLARPKCDRRTQFVCADGSNFVADQPPDAVVMNEVIYYLPDPIAAVEHHARRPGTWRSRDHLDLRPDLVLAAAAARHRSTARAARIQPDQIRPSGLDRGGVSAGATLGGTFTDCDAQALLQVSLDLLPRSRL